MSWAETVIYYSPYLIQFVFLLLFVSKNDFLIDLFDCGYGKSTFILYGLLALGIVYLYNISFSYYTNILLLYYIIQTIIYYYFLTRNFNVKDSISLAFIISFASSFYWEIPIHFIMLFNREPIINLLIQSMHFAVLPFIYERIIIINRVKFYRYIIYGFIFADISALLSLLIINNYSPYFNMLSRFVCAIMIINGVLINIKRKNI
jgi:hypothetical protein